MENFKRLIIKLMTALSNCSLYSKEHASVETLLKGSIELMNEIFSDSDSIQIMIIDNDLVINRTPLKEPGIHGRNFIRKMKKKGVTGIEFLRGVGLPELRQFVSDIVGNARAVKSYPHIKTGVIDVHIGGFEIDESMDLDSEGLSQFRHEQVVRMKNVFSGFSPFKKLSSSGLEDIVMNFIVTFRREANILSLISPVRAYSEYTYTHATNVAVLTMFQVESLGVSDNLLHDIGISALLHDVGKLFISNEILEKTGSLEDHEWEEIKKHTLYGAKHLASIENIPRIASVVAFQHHKRYDGKGYPAMKTEGGKQHIVSQIVAISDFFDALRSRRPYKRDWKIQEILSLLKKNAGSEFNPLLVDNFSRIIATALKGA
ncbi:cyclic di-GMP phosphodiesterase response regulator RpfG [bacterium BMS3Bbin06]|nr:cyclic di-GMP phosphodiesterase response regulator RpfG [bacterium BMS3Abin08]GBE33648.1 cyclic di-GMP phosphodiesterase response regulator RpfG [bacterium BMS3Bbin06]HDO36532.1 HD domain-containing protein [Nitrospirota bacterium]HDY70428.1 HD domain-containing protein [Nitrospirota bacterium]